MENQILRQLKGNENINNLLEKDYFEIQADVSNEEAKTPATLVKKQGILKI